MDRIADNPVLVVAILAVAVIVITARGVRVVPPGVAYLLTRGGKYARTLMPGVHLLVPFMYNVTNPVSLREQVLKLAKQPVTTSDGVRTSIDLSATAIVTDPRAAVHANMEFVGTLAPRAAKALTEAVAGVSSRDLNGMREVLTAQIAERLNKKVSGSGVRVDVVRISGIAAR